MEIPDDAELSFAFIDVAAFFSVVLAAKLLDQKDFTELKDVAIERLSEQSVSTECVDKVKAILEEIAKAQSEEIK